MDGAEERQQVVLAQTGELNVADEDKLVVLLGEQRRPNDRFRRLLVSLSTLVSANREAGGEPAAVVR